jgi:Kef-type K+ transport system membrane component KefB
MSVQAYTLDEFPLYASSALAGFTMIRSIMGTVPPIVAPSQYACLGYGWGNSLLAFIALALIPIPVVLMTFGERMRLQNTEWLKNL